MYLNREDEFPIDPKSFFMMITFPVEHCFPIYYINTLHQSFYCRSFKSLSNYNVALLWPRRNTS
ncbi:hypothetical protein GOP47_0026829 [Adiantum capillus-veneris]|nr:hypothetical protein GOP47_0026829 [Adiantum capillus-veneris]